MRSTAMARSALALGLVGLFTAGLCGVGALLGLALGIAAVVQARRSGGGASVAWAAVSANLFALLSIAPWILLVASLRPMLPEMAELNPFAEPRLPEPQAPLPLEVEPPRALPPPPPPPPAPHRSPSAPAPPRADEEPAPVSDGGRAAASQPLRVGGTIREPRKVRNVSPAYPDIARQARVQGVVILEATISPEGRVTSIRVLRGVPLLNDAAVDAVRQWEYEPTLLNGVAVPVIMTVTVNFALR
jgi:TonB family protein